MTPAQVIPQWEYDCSDEDPLTPPFFVMGTGYSHVIMRSNGEEKECVPQGSITTEDRRKVVWKTGDNGYWKLAD